VFPICFCPALETGQSWWPDDEAVGHSAAVRGVTQVAVVARTARGGGTPALSERGGADLVCSEVWQSAHTCHVSRNVSGPFAGPRGCQYLRPTGDRVDWIKRALSEEKLSTAATRSLA
jgi:hypothetical protein